MNRLPKVGLIAGMAVCLAACAATQDEAEQVVPPMPHPNPITVQLERPWRHVSGPVSDKKYAQDKSNCAMSAHMAPVGGGSPETEFLLVFNDCMKAEGYVPDDGRQASPAVRAGAAR